MSDLDLKLQAGRGDRAAELLRDDVLLGALDAIEQDCIRTWENCPARDAEGKEMAWQLYKTAKSFRSLLTGYVQTGQLAREHLQAYQRKDGYVKRVLKAL